jgi:hypothetical protein
MIELIASETRAPIFQPLRQAADFEAHAVKRGGFAALDFIETRFERRRHPRQLFAHGGSGRVVVARFNSAQALIDRFRHALDLDRDRFDRLRLPALGGGEAVVDVGERAFKARALRVLKRCVHLRREVVAHGIEALLEHRAQRFGFRRAGFHARSERGHRLLQRADRGVGA